MKAIILAPRNGFVVLCGKDSDASTAPKTLHSLLIPTHRLSIAWHEGVVVCKTLPKGMVTLADDRIVGEVNIPDNFFPEKLLRFVEAQTELVKTLKGIEAKAKINAEAA